MYISEVKRIKFILGYKFICLYPSYFFFFNLQLSYCYISQPSYVFKIALERNTLYNLK